MLLSASKNSFPIMLFQSLLFTHSNRFEWGGTCKGLTTVVGKSILTHPSGWLTFYIQLRLKQSGLFFYLSFSLSLSFSINHSCTIFRSANDWYLYNDRKKVLLFGLAVKFEPEKSTFCERIGWIVCWAIGKECRMSRCRGLLCIVCSACGRSQMKRLTSAM